MKEKIETEKIKQLMRDYNFAVTVQNGVEKIYQHTKKELYKIAKKHGAGKLNFLRKIAEELEKEGIKFAILDKFKCAECGKTVSADENHYHKGDKFYCSEKCAAKALGSLVREIS